MKTKFLIGIFSVLMSLSFTWGQTADFSTLSSNICAGDCIDFTDLSTGTNISSWEWTFQGAATPTSTDQNPTNICYPTTGNFDVTLIINDDNGADTVTQQITVNDCNQGSAPTPVFSIDTLLVCAGDCITFTDLSTGDPTSWLWEFEGGSPAQSTNQDPGVVCFETPGSFNVTLTVSNEFGSNTVTNPVVVQDLPEIEGFGDTLIELGGTAVINAEPAQPGTVFWIPSNGLECDTCLETNASPLITTSYFPSVVGANGCIGSDTVLVMVEFRDVVTVPSAFTPNASSNNELHVLGIGIETINFKVYNRYGQLVFSTTDITEGWDGTLDGKTLNQGVFAWQLKYTLVNGTSATKSGTVTLIK